MRLRGPGAGQPAYEQIGSWTVSFDEPSLERAELLRTLLQTPPLSEPAPPLSPGWFTPIALGEQDAVHLFSLAPEGPLVSCGILDEAGAGLAVVACRPGRAATVQTFGGDRASRRLRGLLQARPAVEVRHLAITGIPAVERVDTSGALTTLARPNFSFVIQRG